MLALKPALSTDSCHSNAALPRRKPSIPKLSTDAVNSAYGVGIFFFLLAWVLLGFPGV